MLSPLKTKIRRLREATAGGTVKLAGFPAQGTTIYMVADARPPVLLLACKVTR